MPFANVGESLVLLNLSFAEAEHQLGRSVNLWLEFFYSAFEIDIL